MKAIKKPIPIEVTELRAGESLPLGVIWKDGFLYVRNKLHNSDIQTKFGDFINITNPDDIYPIEKDVFKNTYDVIEPV